MRKRRLKSMPRQCEQSRQEILIHVDSQNCRVADQPLYSAVIFFSANTWFHHASLVKSVQVQCSFLQHQARKRLLRRTCPTASLPRSWSRQCRTTSHLVQDLAGCDISQDNLTDLHSAFEAHSNISPSELTLVNTPENEKALMEKLESLGQHGFEARSSLGNVFRQYLKKNHEERARYEMLSSGNEVPAVRRHVGGERRESPRHDGGPNNHTRCKHTGRWHNRGCIWDKLHISV